MSPQLLYPALHLHPLNDTFIPKQISLFPPGPHNRVKIGRQTNAKTAPAPTNGYFDSKVLSRMHAEVWAEGNKVYIKDVKSSNGTFINGERLSPEGVESDIFELHNNDMVEFGIDITSEDAKTIVHHKVAARCFLVMNADDAVSASRDFANYYRDLGESPMHRRPGMGPNKGGMSGSGVNIDQVLSRLQTELQKSRDTGADLGSLTSTIGEIHDTLGGNLPAPPVPAYRVPPYIPGAANAPPPQQPALQQSQVQTQQLLTSLQTQLQETQNALNGHVERIRNLEGLLDEQERMRTELKEVKERMEEARVEWDRLREDHDQGRIALTQHDGDSDEKDNPHEEELDNETRTIRLDGNDAAVVSSEKVKEAWESPGSRDKSDNNGAKPMLNETSSIAAIQARLEQENSALSQRMEALSNELAAAAQLSSSLKSQYHEAAETIRGLEVKVNTLEKALQSQRSDPGVEKAVLHEAGGVSSPKTAEHNNQRDDILREVESRFTHWKKSFEEAVQKERQGWEEEREQLRMTLSRWEKRSETLQQTQHVSTNASGSRRKRRGKASTVGTSSEETSDSQEETGDGEGSVSPATEEETASTKPDEEASLAAEGVIPKRPRSRRRNYRSGEAAKAARRAAAKAGSHIAADGDASPDKKDGGSALRRRQSWIPFSRSFHSAGQGDHLDDSASTAAKKQQQRKREGATVMDHPALPIVSAAGVLVIGYLAYTAIIQQQK